MYIHLFALLDRQRVDYRSYIADVAEWSRAVTNSYAFDGVVQPI